MDTITLVGIFLVVIGVTAFFFLVYFIGAKKVGQGMKIEFQRVGEEYGLTFSQQKYSPNTAFFKGRSYPTLSLRGLVSGHVILIENVLINNTNSITGEASSLMFLYFLGGGGRTSSLGGLPALTQQTEMTVDGRKQILNGSYKNFGKSYLQILGPQPASYQEIKAALDSIAPSDNQNLAS